MSRTEIIEKLKEILALVVGESPETLDEGARLVEDMGLNSVGILYIVVGIEELFSVRFEDVGFSDFKTIGDVVDYLEEKTGA